MLTGKQHTQNQHICKPKIFAETAKMTVSAYIGLGSNMQNPVHQLTTALAELDRLPTTICVKAASFYLSPPMGPIEQPEYLNTVALLHTSLEVEELFSGLLALEARHGRNRNGIRWGPRPLDLDILLFANRQINTQRLAIPHPGLSLRAFVLYPLFEIDPDLSIPGLGPLRTLIARCPLAGLEKMQ